MVKGIKVTAEKKTKEGNCVLLFWNVPKELKRKFKIKCVEKNMTMQEVINDLLKKFTQ